MQLIGSSAIEETDQRTINDKKRADEWAVRYQQVFDEKERAKAAKAALDRDETKRTIDGQMAKKKEARQRQKQADIDYAAMLKADIEKQNTVEEAKLARRRAQAQDIQEALVKQIQGKAPSVRVPTAQGGGAHTPSPVAMSSPPPSASTYMVGAAVVCSHALSWQGRCLSCWT